nr:unnamed protein product [Spirometra erinaceieuropaei]
MDDARFPKLLLYGDVVKCARRQGQIHHHEDTTTITPGGSCKSTEDLGSLRTKSTGLEIEVKTRADISEGSQVVAPKAKRERSAIATVISAKTFAVTTATITSTTSAIKRNAADASLTTSLTITTLTSSDVDSAPSALISVTNSPSPTSLSGHLRIHRTETDEPLP